MRWKVNQSRPIEQQSVPSDENRENERERAREREKETAKKPNGISEMRGRSRPNDRRWLNAEKSENRERDQMDVAATKMC